VLPGSFATTIPLLGMVKPNCRHCSSATIFSSATFCSSVIIDQFSLASFSSCFLPFSASITFLRFFSSSLANSSSSVIA
jgi:hypothetical protein